jgi:pentatricopeptide repeat protein
MTPGSVDLPVAFWSKKLSRYVRDGEDEKALELFQQMKQEERKPDAFSFVPVLTACGKLQALEQGRQIHNLVVQTGLEADLFVGTSLIDMYSKCGSTEEARRVFNKMTTKDAVTWTAMIVGYVQCAEGHKALQLYGLMKLARVKPVAGTFVAALNACASVGALDEGKRVHAQIVETGCESDPFISSALVDMYAKCGSIDEAREVLEKTGTRNVVSWTALIMGYVKCGQGRKAIELYQLMESEEIEAVPLTYVGVLNACASVGALEEGRRIHEQILQSGCLSDIFVGTSLVDMYAKCGSMKEAQELFDEMENRNVATWNAVLSGYVKCGLAKKALELYRQMLAEGVEPAPTTFAVVLNACTSLGSLEEGKRVHSEIIEYHCEDDIFVGTSLVDMYAKCGSIEDAWRFFIHMPNWDVAAWTAMIMGYVYNGDCKNALALYYQMELEGVEAAPDTFVQVLMSSCLLSEEPDEGDVNL